MAALVAERAQPNRAMSNIFSFFRRGRVSTVSRTMARSGAARNSGRSPPRPPSEGAVDRREDLEVRTQLAVQCVSVECGSGRIEAAMLAAVQHVDEGPAGSVPPPFLNMTPATLHIDANVMGARTWSRPPGSGYPQSGAGIVAPASPAREDVAEKPSSAACDLVPGQPYDVAGERGYAPDSGASNTAATSAANPSSNGDAALSPRVCTPYAT